MFVMEDFDKFYNKALKFLSYRPRSEKEIRDRLQIKYQKSNLKDLSLIIGKVIQKLKDKKFINDEEFAKGWIEQRSKFKPRSLKLIKLELKYKGISEETINNLQLTINDLEQAKKLVEKKMNRSRNKFGMTPEKLGRFLASKGFDWDTIKKAIDPIKSQDGDF